MIVLPIVIFLFLMLLLPLVITGLTVDMVTVAVTKLGFAPGLAIVLLMAIVIGSAINIPLYQKYLHPVGMPWAGRRSVVALNVGGGLIPVVLALYQLLRGHQAASRPGRVGGCSFSSLRRQYPAKGRKAEEGSS